MENRDNFTEDELSAVISILSEIGQMKAASDFLRSVSLQKLGSVLQTQVELILEKAPELRIEMEQQDRATLLKRDNTNAKRAARLVDAIHEYREILRKATDEVKDEKIRAHLTKRLRKWEPVPCVPTK